MRLKRKDVPGGRYFARRLVRATLAAEAKFDPSAAMLVSASGLSWIAPPIGRRIPGRQLRQARFVPDRRQTASCASFSHCCPVGRWITNTWAFSGMTLAPGSLG